MTPFWVLAYLEVKMVMFDSRSEAYAMSAWLMLTRCGNNGGDDSAGTELTERAVMFLTTVEGMLASPDQTGLLKRRLHHVSTVCTMTHVDQR